jgi:hypothetical protein
VTTQRPRFWALAALAATLLLTASVSAQITAEDYDRANRLRTRFQGLAVDIPETVTAIPNTSRFWYRKSVQGGNEFVLVDASKLTKAPAFDHEKVAAALSTAVKGKYTARTLPFATFRFIEKEQSIEFAVNGGTWQCDLRSYACKAASVPRQGPALPKRVRPKKCQRRVLASTATMFTTAWWT